MSELDELRNGLKEQLPERPEDSEEEMLIQVIRTWACVCAGIKIQVSIHRISIMG